MDKTEIENPLLQHRYTQWEERLRNSIYTLLRKLNDTDEKVFGRVANDMDEAGPIVWVGHGVLCDIAPDGIFEAEKRTLALPETKLNQSILFEIIRAVFETREGDGRHGKASGDELLSTFAFDEWRLFNNVRPVKRNCLDRVTRPPFVFNYASRNRTV